MKRVYAKVAAIFLASVLLICMCPAALADEGFDFEAILGDKPGYSYNKYTGEWQYIAAAGIWESDNLYAPFFSFGIVTNNSGETPEPKYTTLSIVGKAVNRENGRGKTLEMKSIEFHIGDDVYAYDNMFDIDLGRIVDFGPKAQWLTEAIAAADIEDVTVIIYTMDERYEFAASDIDGYEDFREGCILYNEYFVKYYLDVPELDEVEIEYPLTINGTAVVNHYSVNGTYA